MEQDPLVNFLSGLSKKIQVEKSHKVMMEKLNAPDNNIDTTVNPLESVLAKIQEKVAQSQPTIVIPEITTGSVSIETIIPDIKEEVTIDEQLEEASFVNFIDKLKDIIVNPAPKKPIEEVAIVPEVAPEPKQIDKSVEVEKLPAIKTNPYVDQLEKTNAKPVVVDNNDYTKELDKLSTSIAGEQSPEKLSQITKLLEDYIDKRLKKVAVMAEYAGGGGSVAVQYAKGGTMDGDLNVTGQYLSAGVNINTLFGTGGGGSGSQTLSFNSTTANLSISNGNTVSLSALSGNNVSGNPAVDSVVISNSASWNSSYTVLTANSANWTNVYTTLTANSASWSDTYTTVNSNSANWSNTYTAVYPNSANWNTSYISTTALNLSSSNWNSICTSYTVNSGSFITAVSGTANQINTSRTGSTVTLSLPQSAVFPGNVTILGNLSAQGTATFLNTIFTTTSALCAVANSSGPSLYIGQQGSGDLASFYDLSPTPVEVLHIGASVGIPGVGIYTSTPNKELTVVGEISATRVIYASGGNSNQWNTAYNIATSYQSTSGSFATNTLLQSTSALLTPLTTTNTLTGQLVLNTAINSLTGNWNTAYASTTALNLSSSKWNSVYTSWNAASATSIVSFNDTRFAKLSAQVYQAGSGINSIQPINGGNTASGNYSNVAGGGGNNASTNYSNVAGGLNNTASNFSSNIAGGYVNTASGRFSNVTGGTNNTASGYASNIAGGGYNTASGYYDSGACQYRGVYSTIGGGYNNNTNNSDYSVIAGGSRNNASGYASGILGGRNNNTNNQACAFIIGQNITASQPNYTYVNNLSSQGVVAAANLTINKAPQTFVNPVTASGTFLIVNVNGTNQAIQLWNYSS